MSAKHIIKNIKNIKINSSVLPRAQRAAAIKPHQMAVTTCPFSAISASKASHSTTEPATCPFSKIKFQTGKFEQEVPQPFRGIDLTAKQRELIKASVPALEAHGVDITKLFYINMLNAHEELKDVFNQANQMHMEQPRALANAVLAYAKHIDDPSPLLPVLNLIANKHVSMFVRPEQYQIVGKHLIEAIAEVLGDAVTAELGEAWTLAYWKLAEILMKMEDELMVGAKGWTDWMQFRIAKKVKESNEVTSFYLEPVDPGMKPLPKFQPGQYISIQFDAPSLGHKQVRQYSLSAAPNSDYYRISVKKETGVNGVAPTSAPGIMSVLLHETKHEGDLISVSHPMGDFFLHEPQGDAPLVLLSGGVGLTPLTSMLQSVLRGGNPSRPVSWIHGARTSAVRPFAQSIRDIAAEQDNVQVHWFNSHAGPEEVAGVDFHYKGFVDLKSLHPQRNLFLDDHRARYYICGPAPFMKGTAASLKELGVTPDRVHMELFGTGGAPSA